MKPRRLLYFALVLSSYGLAAPDKIQAAVNLTRGPYLQIGTPSSAIVRWRTDVATDSRVRYGTIPGSPDQEATDPALTTEHSVVLGSLAPDTKYYYEFGTSTDLFPGDSNDFLVTSPTTGLAVPTRIWAIGDSGTANANARAVRDAYVTFAGSRHTDVWLMLGDNAYNSGTDGEFQAAVFNTYPALLQNTFLWPTRGNHESDSGGTGSTYYNIFSLPTSAEAGGLASGTEAYYSFDYANIHFICLDSQGSSRAVNGPMATWLQVDLAMTTRDWIVAYWHHPPYTKGSHDSDTESQLIDMRQNFLPLLEAGGVDLVLTGHSHSYERSFLLDQHYGSSGTLSEGMKLDGGSGREDTSDGPYQKATYGPAPHEGAVYVVAGSSGQTSGGSLNHPAMFVSLNELGSMVIDVDGNRMDVKFLRETGVIRDYFTLIKGAATVPAAPANLTAIPGNGSAALNWNASAGADFYHLKRADTSGGPYLTVAQPVSPTFTDAPLVNGHTYYYVVSAQNQVGESADSTEVAVTPFAQLDQIANGEISVAGTVSGTITGTQSTDNTYEIVTERESAGKPANRYSYLEHKWTVNVVAGSAVTFFVEAYKTPGSDGDDFVFAYSTDDSTYYDIVTITKTADDNTYQTFALPPGLNGTVFIRVRDTDRTPGHKSLDSIFVDHLFVRTDLSSPNGPPSIPGNLAATAGDNEVVLNWVPSSGAATYHVKRANVSGGPYGVIEENLTVSTYTDETAVNGMTYYYVVSAVNEFGESADSNEAAAIPQMPNLPAAPTGLTASATGKRKVNLSWIQSATPGVAQNAVYRSTASGGPYSWVTTIPATTSFQDGNGLSSGVTYYYVVTAIGIGGESPPSQTASATTR